MPQVPLATAEMLQCCGLEQAQELCRVIFCILFLIFRTCYWPLESYKYWVDALACLLRREAAAEGGGEAETLAGRLRREQRVLLEHVPAAGTVGKDSS